MYATIKNEPLDDDSSPRNEFNSCENCKNLARKIDNLQESVNILSKNIEQYNKSIIDTFAEIKGATKMLRKQTALTTAKNDFPITSEKMLQNLEKKISPDNHDIYVSTMCTLWRDNVGRNLENILDSKIVMSYNIDGTHGKLRLKDCKNFYRALIDSILSLPYLQQRDPELLLRQAIQLCKKKIFKKQSASKKKSDDYTEYTGGDI